MFSSLPLPVSLYFPIFYLISYFCSSLPPFLHLYLLISLSYILNLLLCTFSLPPSSHLLILSFLSISSSSFFLSPFLLPSLSCILNLLSYTFFFPPSFHLPVLSSLLSFLKSLLLVLPRDWFRLPQHSDLFLRPPSQPSVAGGGDNISWWGKVQRREGRDGREVREKEQEGEDGGG